MSLQNSKKSVAVITSTIGRDTLHRAIKSVKAQTYPCTHYVFIDGDKYKKDAERILVDYPDVIKIYLPMNTGKNNWVNSSINAIAPFLVEEDIICYLDDDNWYEPNHIETLVKEMTDDVEFVYSLRNFYHADGHFICQDIIESLGFLIEEPLPSYDIPVYVRKQLFSVRFNSIDRNHIDTNSYAFTRNLAIHLAQSWYSGIHNDRYILAYLIENKTKGTCTYQFTQNYELDLFKVFKGFDKELEEYNVMHNEMEEMFELVVKYVCERNNRILNLAQFDYSYDS